MGAAETSSTGLSWPSGGLNKAKAMIFALSKFAESCDSTHGWGPMSGCTVWISSVWNYKTKIIIFGFDQRLSVTRNAVSDLGLITHSESSSRKLTVLAKNWKLKMLDAWTFLFKNCDRARKRKKNRLISALNVRCVQPMGIYILQSDCNNWKSFSSKGLRKLIFFSMW